MINLKTLIKAAPFDEETGKSLLAKLENNELDQDQQYEITNLCWEMITTLYETELSFRFDRMHYEEATGQKKYQPNDFVEEKLKIIRKFSDKLESASTETEIEEVRKQLELHSTAKKPTN